MGIIFPGLQEVPELHVVPGHHQLMLESPQCPQGRCQHVLPTCDIKVSHAEVKP